MVGILIHLWNGWREVGRWSPFIRPIVLWGHRGRARPRRRWGNSWACWGTVGPNVKNPPKIRIQKKIVKLTNHTISFNSLTSFEYEHHTFAGNKNAESCSEKFVKSHYNKLKWTCFWRILAIWNLCVRPPPRLQHPRSPQHQPPYCCCHKSVGCILVSVSLNRMQQAVRFVC